jgi:hypothetical protein
MRGEEKRSKRDGEERGSGIGEKECMKGRERECEKA